MLLFWAIGIGLEGLTLVVASSYAEDYSISFLLNFVSLQNIVFCFAQLI